MADFLTNLWSSVFTAGPTPTLIAATNAAFGALQLLLLALLIATYSIHFAILSVLCAGLWWSINWFATELQAAQAKEEEAAKLRKRKKGDDWRGKGQVEDSADDEGEDTEVEESGKGTKESVSSVTSRHATSEEDVPISDGSNSSRDVFCICRRPEAGIMIKCEVCHEWYHGKCLKIARGKVKEDDKYTCPICDWPVKIEDDDGRVGEEVRDIMRPSELPGGSGVATGVEQGVSAAESRQRTVEDFDRSGEISTDSEWEKVSQEGDR